MEVNEIENEYLNNAKELSALGHILFNKVVNITDTPLSLGMTAQVKGIYKGHLALH